MSAHGDVRNNEGESRYELALEDGLAFATYDRREGALVFTHTIVPPEMEGKGVGSRLIQGALADVRRQGLRIVPLCSFVAAYVERHPEDQDLLASEAPG
ncbi:MAG TPA: GNAT family N-acetyltransferase [Sphingobium sp.]